MTATAELRRQRRLAREHFMLDHWLFFPECRGWTVHDWCIRLKAEGLLAPTTSHRDCSGVTDLWVRLQNLP